MLRTWVFDVYVPGERAAGIRGFEETVIISIESGDPTGEEGEFEEFMIEALKEWYDGSKVTVRKERGRDCAQ